MKRALLALVALAGCDRPPSAAPPLSAGPALEQAARARGLVADPAASAPGGLYASATDRLCLVAQGREYRIGALVDYGDGQSCLARGTARGRDRIEARFDGCRLTASLEGDRISFPAVLPAGCERLCRGRASLAALSADRLSPSEAEARSAAAPDGAPLCG